MFLQYFSFYRCAVNLYYLIMSWRIYNLSHSLINKIPSSRASDFNECYLIGCPNWWEQQCMNNNVSHTHIKRSNTHYFFCWFMDSECNLYEQTKRTRKTGKITKTILKRGRRWCRVLTRFSSLGTSTQASNCSRSAATILRTFLKIWWKQEDKIDGMNDGVNIASTGCPVKPLY